MRILLLTTAALALTACGGEDYEDANRDTTAMNDMTDDEPTLDETGDEEAGYGDGEGLGQTPPVNTVQDAAAGPVGVGTAAIVGGDTEGYLRNATLGNLYEIQAGEIAMEMGGSEEVRQIGQRIVEDHRALQQQMEAALANTDVEFTPPTELDERRQGMIDNLHAASSDTFDAAFLHQQEAAHLEAITLHEGYEARGDIDALQQVAVEASDVIETHLGMVTDALGAAVDGE